ncbi:MAG: cupin [Verrucomicrobia bacterium]|nr:MAG: cupin [Verrucomicrobiota bacterium]
MSQNTFKHLPDLLGSITCQPDSIVSRTLHSDEQSKIVLFGFDAGQELSEHTAAVPAVMHFLEGEAEVKLGAETVQATAGTWVHMAPGLPHAISARTPVKMLLTLFKKPRPAAQD